jgi:hypothetical protein
MATQPPVVDRSTSKTVAKNTDKDQTPAPESPPPRPSLGQVLRSLNWRLLLMVGLGAGILWTTMLTRDTRLQFLAGLIPVTAGILVGRRVRDHINWHAFMLSLLTMAGASISAAVLIFVEGLTEAVLAAIWLGTLTLFPFPAFGVIMSARSEQRARAMREELARRGGKLEKPGRVQSLEDLQALSLPQLGGYVADLFRKHGFSINDYVVEKDKDRIDFTVTHEDQPWLLRVTTTDKVKPGLAQELAQRMKAEGVTKGAVITSMEFQEAATRWAKDKPVVLIDGATLLTMDD